MSIFGKPPGKKYHQRTIEISTYEYDSGRLVVEGCLTDRRLQEYYLATGEKKSPGILHQMIIQLLVSKTDLTIEDLQVDMPGVPREECLETADSLESVKGLRIAGGFTAKVKALNSRGKGCSHLVALLTAMGGPAIQGYAAYNMQDPAGFISGMAELMVDSCWTWRQDGPLIKALRGKTAAKNNG